MKRLFDRLMHRLIDLLERWPKLGFLVIVYVGALVIVWVLYALSVLGILDWVTAIIFWPFPSP